MRFLSYNVHGWKTPDGRDNLDSVASLLKTCLPDLVGLNEVYHPSVEGSRDRLTLLAEELGMVFAFGGVRHGEHGSHQVGESGYGNACVSRWPILAYAVHRLPPGTAGGLRVLLESRILIPDGSPFTLYITHLDHRSEEHRLAQWKAAQTWLVRDRSRPHVLLGDFNALAAVDYGNAAALSDLTALHAERGWSPPEFELVKTVIEAGYVDAGAECSGEPGPTWPAHLPERRVDYMFLPQSLKPVLIDCHPLRSQSGTLISDHLPLVMDLSLPSNRTPLSHTSSEPST